MPRRFDEQWRRSVREQHFWLGGCLLAAIAALLLGVQILDGLFAGPAVSRDPFAPSATSPDGAFRASCRAVHDDRLIVELRARSGGAALPLYGGPLPEGTVHTRFDGDRSLRIVWSGRDREKLVLGLAQLDVSGCVVFAGEEIRWRLLDYE